MNRLPALGLLAVGLFLAGTVRADDTFAPLAVEVNKKVVKIYGSGGIKGLPSYGTGIVVSPDGYVLTVYSHLLDTQALRVHLPDGQRLHAEIIATEPELDAALIKLGVGKEKVTEELPYFDLKAEAKRPLAKAGTGVLAFSNMYNIVIRDEPMSVQQGHVMSYSKLYGKIGVHDAAYTGNVYIIDAITNNPGAAGGPVVNFKGELLGLIGKELRNELTNTWINYAVPLTAKAKVRTFEDDKEKEVEVTILDLLEHKKDYNKKFKGVKLADKKDSGGYLGVILVPNVVERTPPYVDDIIPGTPAQKADLKPDDLIVFVDGIPVPSIDSFNQMMSNYGPEATVQLEVRRGDKLMTVRVKLDKQPKKPDAKKPEK
jgi:serine protease Do